MKPIIMDTNILFAGLYSANGASFRMLEQIAEERIQTVLSTPLLFEYEDVLKRHAALLKLHNEEIDVILSTLCALSRFQSIYFLWRPYLRDPKDDHILELAVAAKVDMIVTHNLKDFSGIDRFGVEALTPKTLLERLR